MAAIVAGTVSPLISGTIFCAMLSACERTGDLKRAEDWSRTARIHLNRTCGDKLPILHSHCRTAYGVVLCDTGRWTEAEVEILYAFGPSSTKALSKQADAAGALARLRLMQGRLEEVSDLLAPYAGHFEVSEQLARLHLLREEPDLAAAVLNRGLHDLVGDRLRAGRLDAFSKYGSRTSPSLPGGADNASRENSPWPIPSICAVASSNRAAMGVPACRRKRPVASAESITSPVGSAIGESATAETTPEVPIEMMTSPGPAPTPNAAAALSPAPGPTTAPQWVTPAGSEGSRTPGTTASWPRARRSRSVLYSPVRADQ
jgi:hypothetical protein